MALTTLQYRNMRDLMRGFLSANGLGPTDADVLGFINQLFSDATGSAALPTPRQFVASEVMRRMLSGAAFAPLDADVLAYFAQLQLDASGAPGLSATRYRNARDILRGLMSCDGFGASESDILSYFASLNSGTPLTIITSVPVRAWLRADLGVTIATGVSSWVDQTTNAYNFAQGSGSLQPSRNTSDPTLGNQATITGDGVGTYLLNVPIPIAASYWRCTVLKQNGWTVNSWAMSTAGGAGKGLLQASISPQLLLDETGATSNPSGGAAIGAWKRVTDQQNNTTADGILVGSVSGTGTALGRTTGTTDLFLFSSSGPSQYFAGAIAEVIITDGIPNSTEKSNIDAYLLGRYGLSSLFT